MLGKGFIIFLLLPILWGFYCGGVFLDWFYLLVQGDLEGCYAPGFLCRVHTYMEHRSEPSVSHWKLFSFLVPSAGQKSDPGIPPCVMLPLDCGQRLLGVCIHG